jgi:hypothetical protein
MDRQALNKYNAPEMLGALFASLEAAGLDDTVAQLKRMGVSRLINDAWMSRPKMASDLEKAWGKLAR